MWLDIKTDHRPMALAPTIIEDVGVTHVDKLRYPTINSIDAGKAQIAEHAFGKGEVESATLSTGS